MLLIEMKLVNSQRRAIVEGDNIICEVGDFALKF